MAQATRATIKVVRHSFTRPTRFKLIRPDQYLPVTPSADSFGLTTTF